MTLLRTLRAVGRGPVRSGSWTLEDFALGVQNLRLKVGSGAKFLRGLRVFQNRCEQHWPALYALFKPLFAVVGIENKGQWGGA